MAKRQNTIDYQQESERFAEWFGNKSRAGVQDRDSFDLAYQKEIKKSDLDSKEKQFRELVFEHYANKNPNVSKERLFSKAGGKNLALDRETTAKTIVSTKPQYIKKGAKRVDLAGYDVRESDRNIPARNKGRVVFSTRETITIRKKQVVIFRDRKGRFSSVRTW